MGRPENEENQHKRREGQHALPVIEIFGPTIQGEGIVCGAFTSFVRFGGCGYRCRWCDTLYAVLPHEVKANRTMMTPQEIGERLLEHGQVPSVTLSGGDPCIHDLWLVIHSIRSVFVHQGWKSPAICVETQGQLWQEWLLGCEIVTISPKPPSSGEKVDLENLSMIVSKIWRRVNFKCVVKDTADLIWVIDNIATVPEYKNIPVFLQSCTDLHANSEYDRVIRPLEWLTQEILQHPQIFNRPGGLRVLPQMHRLMFPGIERGV